MASMLADPPLPPAAYELYPRTKRDVYETFSILRHLLPAELIAPILTAACYCTSTLAENKHMLTFGTHNEQPACTAYLTSRALTRREGGRVRRVRFRITTRDEGACSSANGGYSWWEAAVVVARHDVRRLKKEDVPRDEAMGDMVVECTWQRYYELLTVRRRKKLCHNPLEGIGYVRHEIVWSADEGDEDERAWVTALAEDEAIAILPWHKVGGWRNDTKCASIEYWTPDVR